jgi:hypothetical protein
MTMMHRLGGIGVLSMSLLVGCSSGQSMVDACESISTQYESALMKAEECVLGGPSQCTRSVIGDFYCQCMVFVNGDTDTLATISGRFKAAGCQSGCRGLCAREVPASCQADSTSSTGGRCLSVQPDGGP